MVPYKNILVALSQAGVEYLVAGGFAVNFHGLSRSTFDLDLIVHLNEENVINFDKVMTGLGFRPKVPVTGKDFAKKENREKWIVEKNMIVFSYVNPNNPMELIDVFINEPKPFAEMYAQRFESKVFGVVVPSVGLQDLLDMKLEAGRPKDKLDIHMIHEKMKKEEKS